MENKWIDWYQVIGWQRWGEGMVFPNGTVERKERLIYLKKGCEKEISPLWKRIGYKIKEVEK